MDESANIVLYETAMIGRGAEGAQLPVIGIAPNGVRAEPGYSHRIRNR